MTINCGHLKPSFSRNNEVLVTCVISPLMVILVVVSLWFWLVIVIFFLSVLVMCTYINCHGKGTVLIWTQRWTIRKNGSFGYFYFFQISSLAKLHPFRRGNRDAFPLYVIYVVLSYEMMFSTLPVPVIRFPGLFTITGGFFMAVKRIHYQGDTQASASTWHYC